MQQVSNYYTLRSVTCGTTELAFVGTVNYVSKEWSPVNAEVDCLGSGNDDIDREGRYA